MGIEAEKRDEGSVDFLQPHGITSVLWRGSPISARTRSIPSWIAVIPERIAVIPGRLLLIPSWIRSSTGRFKVSPGRRQGISLCFVASAARTKTVYSRSPRR